MRVHLHLGPGQFNNLPGYQFGDLIGLITGMTLPVPTCEAPVGPNAPRPPR
jgi:hypothetical protein